MSQLDITYNRQPVGHCDVDADIAGLLQMGRWYLVKPPSISKTKFVDLINTDPGSVLQFCKIRTLIGSRKHDFSLPRIVWVLKTGGPHAAQAWTRALAGDVDALRAVVRLTPIPMYRDGNPLNNRLDNLVAVQSFPSDVEPRQLGDPTLVSDESEIDRLKRQGLL